MESILLRNQIDSKLQQLLTEKFNLITSVSELNKGEIYDLKNLDAISEPLKSQIIQSVNPVILLNTNTHLLTDLFGFAVPSEHVIFIKYENTYIIDSIDANASETHSELVVLDEDATDDVEQSKEHETNIAQPNKAEEQLSLNKIFSIINNHTHGIEFIKDETPVNLPEKQYKCYYYIIDHPNFVINPTYKENSQQTASTNLIFKIQLFASYNPNVKYLNIEITGNSNPGKLIWDSKSERGLFQDNLTVTLTPLHKQVMTLNQNKPENINSETQYSVTAGFSIGVNIKKEPEFPISFNYSSTKNYTIKDFVVINDANANAAKWIYQMGMTKDGVKGLIDTGFFTDELYPLPILAKHNLQCGCQATWIVTNDKNFADKAEIELGFSISYLDVYNRGRASRRQNHYFNKHEGQYKTLTVDFGTVEA